MTEDDTKAKRIAAITSMMTTGTLRPYQQAMLDAIARGETIIIGTHRRDQSKSELARIYNEHLAEQGKPGHGPDRQSGATGNSPDFIILDDPHAEPMTQEQRDKMYDWVTEFQQRPGIFVGLDLGHDDRPGFIDEYFAERAKMDPQEWKRQYQCETPVDQMIIPDELSPIAERLFAEPEPKPRPHWQQLNGGDKPWAARHRKGRRK